MYSRLSRVSLFAGLVGVLAVAILIAPGCRSTNPFLAAAFNMSGFDNNNGGIQSGGPPPGPDGGGTTNTDVLSSVCDLPVTEQFIQVSILNASEQFVDFSMTFAVSAGPGGFVCDDQLQDYLNAGYSDALAPGLGGSANIGCDILSLGSGTRLLTLEFGINEVGFIPIPPNVGGDPEADLPTRVLQRRDGRGPNIPLPELIVFGNADPNFICAGGEVLGDLCTQRGFVYTAMPPPSERRGLPVGKSVESSRIQGTICAENFGTAPEWRLDKTLNNQVQPFQYGRGGTIVVSVLNRALDDLTNTRNQAVWLVTDADDNTLHFPDG